MGNGASASPSNSTVSTEAVFSGIAQVVANKIGFREEKKIVTAYTTGSSWGKNKDKSQAKVLNLHADKLDAVASALPPDKKAGDSSLEDANTSPVRSLSDASSASHDTEESSTDGSIESKLQRKSSRHRRRRGEESPSLNRVSWEASAAELADKVKKSAATSATSSTLQRSSTTEWAKASFLNRPLRSTLQLQRSNSESLLKLKTVKDKDSSDEESDDTETTDGEYSEFKKFFNGVDKDGSGGIDLDEFVECVCHISVLPCM